MKKEREILMMELEVAPRGNNEILSLIFFSMLINMDFMRDN